MIDKTMNEMLDDMEEYFREMSSFKENDAVTYYKVNRYLDYLKKIRERYNNSINDLFEPADVEELLKEKEE